MYIWGLNQFPIGSILLCPAVVAKSVISHQSTKTYNFAQYSAISWQEYVKFDDDVY